jgi:holo-[acyl-carrier protein] synthase
MKTVGIGVDIIDNKRFKKLIKDKKFINRISVKRKFLLQKKN